MEQNNIWMRYLILGLVINCLLLLSCGKIRHEPVKNAEFHFVNNTKHTITYNYGLDRFNLKPDNFLIFKEEQSATNGRGAETYLTPFKVLAFDVTLTFDELKCLLISPTGAFGPLNIKNYVAEKIDKNTYKFTYTFTEEDYNRATVCQ